MTPQEAIDIVNDVTWFDNGRHYGKIERARDLVVSALEKQIPKNPKTNFERIKAMSIDEMVEFLEAAGDSPCTTICNNFDRCRLNSSIERICKNHFKQWLESEVEEE